MREAEFSEVYRAERSKLERLVHRHVGCAATARDIVQDVFLRYWERGEAGHDSSAAFLSRVARNAAIDHIRAERVRRDHAARTAPVRETVEAISGFDFAVAQEDRERLGRAIAALPERTRAMFLMNRVDGCSFREIARAFGISERAVAKHMSRAVQACSRALDPDD